MLGNYAVYADENANLETNKTEEVSNNEDSAEIEEELGETTEKVKTKEQAQKDLESEKESLSKKTTIKKNKEKKTNKNKIPKATIKKVENLIFQDNQLEIYKMKTVMSRDWLSPYYSLQKVLLVNLTDSELKVNGDILNKVLKQEARSKVIQIAQEKKAKSNAASSAGALNGGLLGAAVIMASVGADISIDTGESELLGQINKLIDDKPFSVTVPAKEEMTFSFLFTRQKDIEPQILLAYQKAQNDLSEKTFIIKNFDEALGKRLLMDTSLYGFAYFDQKISDKKIGAYFVNSPVIKPAIQNKNTKKNTKKEIKENQDQVEIIDKSYETATYIEPVNLMLPLPEEEKSENNTDKTAKTAVKNDKKSKVKKPKTVQKLEGITSSHIYPQKDFRIFIYQNIKKQPNRSSIDLIKLIVNKKENFRSIKTNNNFTAFSLKEIKPGISELKVSLVLAPGEYLLIDQDQDLGIEFTIEKPPAKSKTNKTKK